MRFRLLFSALVLLVGLTSCIKQPYYFSNQTGSCRQVQKTTAVTLESSTAHTEAPAQLSASVAGPPEAFFLKQETVGNGNAKVVIEPAQMLLSNTLRPDTVKAKPAATKTQGAKKPANAKPAKELPKKRNQWIALALALLIGGLGAHRFYLGHYVSGAFQLSLVFLFLLTVAAAGGGMSGPGLLLILGIWVWNLVDIVLIAIGTLKPYQAEYKVKI